MPVFKVAEKEKLAHYRVEAHDASEARRLIALNALPHISDWSGLESSPIATGEMPPNGVIYSYHHGADATHGTITVEKR